jgi:hypothetical protein
LFPYETPEGIEHWTLWSRSELRQREIVAYIEDWCVERAGGVYAEWQYEENARRSFDVPHVHVYLSTRVPAAAPTPTPPPSSAGPAARPPTPPRRSRWDMPPSPRIGMLYQG